jgi:xanthine dehydrogenase accessory factor
MDLDGVIFEHLERGGKGVLVTIVDKEGSAPRDEGARMFVTSGNKIFGSIGGGSAEAEACREAAEVLKEGRHRMLHVGMAGKDVTDGDMICGGNVSIFLEPVDAGHRAVYDAVRFAMRKAAKGFVVTRYSEAGLFKSFLGENGTVVGAPVDAEIIELLMNAGGQPVFSEGLIAVPIRIECPLYIFGAGHVSQHICRIAAMVDFGVTVIDDRGEYCNKVRFPDARSVIVDDFSTVFDYLPFSGIEFAVIVTRGHQHDMTVLEQALKKPTRYVGMIGSRRKTMMIFNHLTKRGFDEVLLGSVFTPIGLDIGSETPQEIAVSIVAQLIEVRHRPEVVPDLSPQPTGNAERPAGRPHRPGRHKIMFG